MDLELRHLRCLVAIVDSGTFTDAAIELGVSQAAVSRNLISLERVLGVRLLHRTSRTITPTTAGVHILTQARQLLAAADNLVAEAAAGHATLRIGHAWAAMGRHTREFQRRWADSYPETGLELIRATSRCCVPASTASVSPAPSSVTNDAIVPSRLTTHGPGGVPSGSMRCRSAPC
jgi:DNA-binding transcriptional LysR family regulator